MAKVGKYSVSILGEHYELPINVSSKGEFSTVIPLQYRLIGKLPLITITKLELEKDIDRFVKEVNEAAKTVSLIIAYRLTDRVSPFASSMPDAGITLSWRAFHVETTGSWKTYHEISRIHSEYNPPAEKIICDGFMRGSYTYPSERNSIDPEKDPIIPFTPEAYTFFENSIKAVKGIYEKLEGFLREGNIQQTIQGSFNLLNPNNN